MWQICDTLHQTTPGEITMTIHLFEGGHTSMRRTELTTREREVLSLVWQGKMNKEIGRELGATERTIKAHRRRVMEKLEAGSFVELLSIARHLELGAK